MIIRTYFACETCGHNHTLRVSMGIRDYHLHAFPCVDCGEPMELAVHQMPPNARFEPVKNCVKSDTEGSVINLHPDFLVPDKDRFRDKAFISIDAMRRLQGDIDSKAINYTRDDGREAAYKRDFAVDRVWPFTRTVWSLFLNGKYQRCADFIQRKQAEAGLKDDSSPYQIIFSACQSLARRHGREVFEGLITTWEQVETNNPGALKELRDYFIAEHWNERSSTTIAVFNDYMKNFSDYSQVFIHNETGMNAKIDVFASSQNFEATKMMFGNAFENLASFYVLPACLNNIINGRRFDTFATMDLDKFLELDKTNRANPFKDSPLLHIVTEKMNVQIRNASHHGAMRFNPQSGYISYRPKKNGPLKYMKYVDYITHCNAVIQATAAYVCFVIAKMEPPDGAEEAAAETAED